MILPIGIEHTIRRWPWVTIAIIVTCTLMQIYSSTWAPSPEEVVQHYDTGYRNLPEDPEERDRAIVILEQSTKDMADRIPVVRFGYLTGTGLSWRLVTAAFVHAGWWHLIGNMLFLWLVGAALEDRWGPLKFLGFYLGGAVASTLAFDHLGNHPETVLVGASGAISTLMGAFLVFFTRMQIRMLYWFWYRAGTFHVVAYVALPLWLAEQFLYRAIEETGTGVESVAYTAHISGFLLGFAVAMGLRLLNVHGDAADDPGEAASGDGDLPRAVVKQLPKQLPAADLERFEQCMQAIARRDAGAVRTLASRVILDLARAGDHRRVLDVYDAMVANLTALQLTDGAFAAAANSADASGKREQYVAIAGALSREHPYSTQTPKVLWRLAQVHREMGNAELAKTTLQDLAKRFPRDEYGKRAADAVRG